MPTVGAFKLPPTAQVVCQSPLPIAQISPLRSKRQENGEESIVYDFKFRKPSAPGELPQKDKKKEEKTKSKGAKQNVAEDEQKAAKPFDDGLKKAKATKKRKRNEKEPDVVQESPPKDVLDGPAETSHSKEQENPIQSSCSNFEIGSRKVESHGKEKASNYSPKKKQVKEKSIKDDHNELQNNGTSQDNKGSDDGSDEGRESVFEDNSMDLGQSYIALPKNKERQKKFTINRTSLSSTNSRKSSLDRSADVRPIDTEDAHTVARSVESPKNTVAFPAHSLVTSDSPKKPESEVSLEKSKKRKKN